MILNKMKLYLVRNTKEINNCDVVVVANGRVNSK